MLSGQTTAPYLPNFQNVIQQREESITQITKNTISKQSIKYHIP